MACRAPHSPSPAGARPLRRRDGGITAPFFCRDGRVRRGRGELSLFRHHVVHGLGEAPMILSTIVLVFPKGFTLEILVRGHLAPWVKDSGSVTLEIPLYLLTFLN